MYEKTLAEVLERTDLDLKIRQGAPDIDFEEQVHIEIARGLLKNLRLGIQRGDQQVVLGNAWSIEAVRWILPAIRAAEKNGTTVVYKTPEPRHYDTGKTDQARPRLSL
jgi:hypothetical protein